MIIRLELLGYEYRGVDYPNGGVCVMYADPAKKDDTLLLPGPDLSYIMERISEMPILTTDPTARMVEMRNRGQAAPAPRAEGQGVDSAALLRRPGRTGGGITAATGSGAAQYSPDMQRATERQCKSLFAIGREAGLSREEVEEWSMSLYGIYVDQLNRRDASALIGALQRRRNELAD